MQRGKETAWFGDGVLHMRACVRACVRVCEDSGAAGNTQDQKGGHVLQTALVARGVRINVVGSRDPL